MKNPIKSIRAFLKTTGEPAFNINSYTGQYRSLKRAVLIGWIIPWIIICRVFVFLVHYIAMPHYTIDVYGLCFIIAYLFFVVVFVWQTTKSWQQGTKIFWRGLPIVFLSFLIAIFVIGTVI